MLLSCKENKPEPLAVEVVKEDPPEQITKEQVIDYDTLLWSEITDADGIALDMKYASDDNFTKKQIYPCERCFLRPELADKIRTIQKDIQKRYGWSLKLYDCYRPRPAQQRLWDIVPNASYVTPPHKGSMHNRGLALDVSIIGEDGIEWDFGSPFDSFSKKSHTDYLDHSDEVLKNRKILKKLMELHGLRGIRTEWWHYSLRGVSYPLDDWEWVCDQ